MFRSPATILGSALALVSMAGCGPSPARVCNHMKALTAEELGEAAATTLDDEACRSLMRRERKALGITEYREQARCILDADSYEALGRCQG